MKVVILDADTLRVDNDLTFECLEEFGELVVYNLTPQEMVAERIKDADAILCNKSKIRKEELESAKNLKYIGLFATGYNNIDIEETKKRGITVCNAGSYSTDSVAQHTFALILEFYNKVAKYDSFVKEGGWIRSNVFAPFLPMSELNGKTLGIIGYGAIGKQVARIGKAFNMDVLANKRSTNNVSADGMIDEHAKYATVDQILKEADIVTMHCPLNGQSQRMCDKKFFGKMKENALFINTSRGGVVVEDDLIEALNSGTIAGAGLDVIAVEPMEENCKLLNVNNLMVTPHSAWAPLETRQRLLKIVSTNLKKWVAGTPVNVIE